MFTMKFLYILMQLFVLYIIHYENVVPTLN